MAAIDVGGGATNRGTSSNNGTYVDKNNPSNLEGYINTVELWFANNATGVKVGTFSGSGTSYTSRDFASIGNVTAGSKQTFTNLKIRVKAGDFLGIYFATGDIEYELSGGSDVYYKAGDQFGAGAQTYTQNAGDLISIYATGDEGSFFF